MSNIKPWKTKQSKTVLDHPFFKVRADHVQLPSGLEIPDYTVWENTDVAQVVPITKDGKYVLAKMYKHGLGKVILEFPGGFVDKEANPRKAGLRELEEETGYSTSLKLESLGKFSHHPTKESGLIHLFVARDVEIKETSRKQDETEDIEVVLMSKQELQKYLQTTLHIQSGTMIGFLLTSNRQ